MSPSPKKKRIIRPSKRAHKLVKELAKGLSVTEAGVKAGYTEHYAKSGLFQSIKRPCIQSAFTDACESVMRERGIGLVHVVKPYFDALDAPLIVKSTQLGDAYKPIDPATKLPFPDHAIRMTAAEKITELFGGKPRDIEMPAPPAKGLLVIINKEGGTVEAKTIEVHGRTTIQPEGEANPKPLPVKIKREGT